VVERSKREKRLLGRKDVVLAGHLISEEVEELRVLVEIFVDIGLESVRRELILSGTGLRERRA
jgi:hypothetical protein